MSLRRNIHPDWLEGQRRAAGVERKWGKVLAGGMGKVVAGGVGSHTFACR